jgi:hypothetical protein
MEYCSAAFFCCEEQVARTRAAERAFFESVNIS